MTRSVEQIAGSARILRTLGGGDDLPPITQARIAARRYALLDELDDNGRTVDGLTWRDAHDLGQALGVMTGGNRSVFWLDVEWLEACSYIEARWTVNEWPNLQNESRVSSRLVRLREALLRTPRLRQGLHLHHVAEAAHMHVSALCRVVGSTPAVSLELTTTRAAFHLLHPNRRES